MAIGINFYVYVTTLELIAYHFTMHGAFWQESATSMLRIVETTTKQLGSLENPGNRMTDLTVVWTLIKMTEYRIGVGWSPSERNPVRLFVSLTVT